MSLDIDQVVPLSVVYDTAIGGTVALNLDQITNVLPLYGLDGLFIVKV
jgi:hypothetical protein